LRICANQNQLNSRLLPESGVFMSVEANKSRLLREEAYRDLLDLLYGVTSAIPSRLDINELIKSIIGGLKRLGFDRAAVWLLDEAKGKLGGTWGTDEEGNLRDERNVELSLARLPGLRGYSLRIADSESAATSGVEAVYIPIGEESRFKELWGYEPPYPGYYWRREKGDNISLPIAISGKSIGTVSVDNFITGRGIKKEDAEILAMFAVNMGIVLHNARLMAELHQRTTFLESILDNANLWINLLDSEGNITLWNKAAERISGYKKEEVIGSMECWQWLFPDSAYRSQIVKEVRKLIRGTPMERFETRIITKMGEEKILSWHSVTLPDVDGEILGSVAIAEDITKQWDMELALRQSAEEYRRAVETANSFVVGLNKDGEINLFNSFAEELTGYKREEVIGKSWFDIFIPCDDRERIFTVFKDMGSGHHSSTYENSIQTKDGKEVLLLWSNSFVRDDAGNIAGTLSYGIDVTQQRKLERQLAQSEKMSALGQLISGVAHELNNPLTGVIGYSQLLLGTNCDDETKRMLTIVNNEAGRCHRIVDNLLHFAREYEPKKECIQINDVIQSTLDLKRYQIRVDNIQVELHLSGDIPETMGDPHHMQQVFMNIVNNAHQAMLDHSGSGRLTVETELRDDDIIIRFKDTGPGIPEDVMDSIFDPFFTTKPEGKGTGLGLSICRALVEDHGGRIYVESNIGAGTTFTIELPLEMGKVVSAAEISTKEDEIGSKQVGSRILVVDDEQGILDLFMDMLDTIGHKVTTARNGDQAMDRLNEGEYDLIFCDMKMPGFSGQNLYDLVKVTHPESARRIVFVTGDTVNPETQEFLKNTGNLYIGKPFRLEEIREIILKSLSENKQND